MKRFIDKIKALYVLAKAKEFAVYVCNDFNNSKDANCWISYGVEEKYDGYENFLYAINDFNTEFINK